MVELRDQEPSEDEFEQELRAALRPHPAPDGFANRVVARSQELPESNALLFPLRRHWFRPVPRRGLRWGIAAVLLLAVALGGYLQHQREQRAGERARQQVLLALRITRLTLQTVQNRVNSDRSN